MIFIRTQRLFLRNLKSKDLYALFNYRNDLRCSKYQRWEDTSIDFLESLIKNNENSKISNKQTLQLAISLNGTDEIIGDLFIAFKDTVITLGYTIDFKFQRNGYAYEILSNLIAYLLDIFSNYEIVCLVHPENKSSIKLLNKLNFKNEGYEKSINSIIYSLN